MRISKHKNIFARDYTPNCFEEVFIFKKVKDDELLKKYNNIWNRLSNIMKKEHDCKPFCNKKIQKTKVIFYGDQAI